MVPGILGKKIGMTQMFRPDGQVVPVTLLQAGPCVVVQRKTPAKDGYDAIQVALVEYLKPARMTKEEKLRIFKLANPQLPVILRADRALVYEQVVKVLDAIKRVPVENLALATEVQ